MPIDGKGQKYIVYSSTTGEFVVKVEDMMTPFLEKIAKENPKYIEKALKSTGWWLSKKIKKGIRSKAPGGEPFASYSTVWKNRQHRFKKEKNYHRPLGRLLGAIGYEGRRAKEGYVPVGWLSRSAVRLGKIQAGGRETKITPKMRRAMWAAGIPVSKDKQYLETPKRKVIEPIYEVEKSQISKYMENKVWDYIKSEEKK